MRFAAGYALIAILGVPAHPQEPRLAKPSLVLQQIVEGLPNDSKQDVRARSANPDSIALISYYPDGAQLTRQIRQAGITQPIIAGGSIYSPKFLELGGNEVNGVLTTVPFFPEDPRPLVQAFVK